MEFCSFILRVTIHSRVPLKTYSANPETSGRNLPARHILTDEAGGRENISRPPASFGSMWRAG
ncbi:MAG: hypothetical protein KKH32_06300 [Bacteroidetes bacterium]|nr:hypothetical protein [Bacteroidota bacterium]